LWAERSRRPLVQIDLLLRTNRTTKRAITTTRTTICIASLIASHFRIDSSTARELGLGQH